MTTTEPPHPAPGRGVFLLLGPAGSGKGTVARHLLDAGVIERHVSMGDTLRALVDAPAPDLAARLMARQPHPDPLGEVRRALQAGALIPDAWTEVLVEQALAREALRGARWALDGFPRRVGAARHLLSALADAQVPVRRVLHLRLADEEVQRRLLQRGRPDDTPGAIEQRLRVYAHEVRPAILHLEAALPPGTVSEVDADGAPAVVMQRVMAALT